jgi:maltose O-acetyltransferase
MSKLLESLFLCLANHLPRISLLDKGRYLLLRLAGMRIQGKSLIWGPVVVRPIGGARNISIGSGCFVNTEVRFGCPDRISIGNNVQIGPRVSFETAGHGLVFVPGKGRGTHTKPIRVEDEVWIGAGAIILQGVTIGRGAVVTSGAVVTRDVEPLTVVGGVPARTIKRITVEQGP